jgi:hypothetical protein
VVEELEAEEGGVGPADARGLFHRTRGGERVREGGGREGLWGWVCWM